MKGLENRKLKLEHIYSKWLNKLIFILENLRDKYSITNTDSLNYNSLSPIGTVDEHGPYSKALEWALNNRKKEDIKNIALTGPYGSGKSSILKSFQKNYKGKDLKFLNISLATFKEEKIRYDADGNELEQDKDTLLRLIETSILQQIFYHEEDKKIPDSRFKKIKSYSSNKLFFGALGFSLFFFAIIHQIYPYLIQSIFKDNPISNFICNMLHYGTFTIIFIGSFFIIYKSIRVLSSLTLSKLQIQNVEMGVGESLNKSVLNHHIDEILYFFSVRPYNVVIIEDLDRFKQTEIFTKLREINLLLNNSHKTRRKEITFIYAVRDEMFIDKDRTKFFDFIIPIIPIINSSNSSEILIWKRDEYGYGITDNFIEDISFYITDMRLLHNITNEFYLYKQNLNQNLNQDKLLAIITYKNIAPNDFVDLSDNKGILFEVLNSKRDFIKSEIERIEEEISQIKKEIQELEGIYLTNFNELRLQYVIRAIEASPYFKSFIINDTEVTINDLLLEENFAYLQNDELLYQKIYTQFHSSQLSVTNEKIGIKFSKIENKVDKTKNYAQKEKQIRDLKTGKTNSLKNKIQQLELKKIETRNLKIYELIKSNVDLELNIPESDNKNFINTLVRNGYIAEDYLDYISLFHAGSITRVDYQFIINIKNKLKLEYNYKLNKVDKVILKINEIDFNSEYIFNYDLLDTLLQNPHTYIKQIESLFNKLSDESKESIDFIKSYVENSSSLKQFIQKIAKTWPNIWNFIDSDPANSDEFKKRIFLYILDFADLDSIKEISKQSNLEQKILSLRDFPSLLSNTSKTKEIIEGLSIIFEDIDFEKSPNDVLEYIYENNYYQISPLMIIPVIKKFGNFNQVTFDTKNYTSIQNSNCQNLIDYLNEFINVYVEHVYLKIETNKAEDETALLSLLNNVELETKHKVAIIKKVDTPVTTLSSIIDASLYSHLLENFKLNATWENLLQDYNSNKQISDSAITYINHLPNATQLSSKKILKEIDGKNIYEKFWKDVIERIDINIDSYDLILKSSPWFYPDLDIEDFDNEKITSLVNNGIIAANNKGFDLLRERFPIQSITLLEKNKKEFLKIKDDLNIDANELELILKSTILNPLEKKEFMDTCTEDIITSNVENLKLICNLLLEHNGFIISDTLRSKILLSKDVSSLSRINLFNEKPSIVNIDSIETFLVSLEGKYSDIPNRSIKAILTDTPYNKNLLNNLIRKGYISSFTETKKGLRINHKRN